MATTNVKEISRVRSLASSGLAKDIRIRASLSQAEIADALGVDRSTVHRWEVGERSPRGPAALRYGELLAGLLAG